MKKRTVALLLAIVLVIGCGIGGTLAWLIAGPKEVKNTFTTSNIDITLEETPSTNPDDGDQDDGTNSYQMIPGHVITKDPKVSVVENSEPCFVFVELIKSDNFDIYMEYTVDLLNTSDGSTDIEGWTRLIGLTGDNADREVYYREVLTPTSNMGILVDNAVKVKTSVTKEMMNTLTSDTFPTLVVKAYASQLYKKNNEKFSALEAWNNISNPTDADSGTPTEPETP